jgi:hypothetical protein
MVKRKPGHLKIRAHPEAVNWLRAEEAEVIEALQQKFGSEISLALEEGWPVEKYQVSEG